MPMGSIENINGILNQDLRTNNIAKYIINAYIDKDIVSRLKQESSKEGNKQSGVVR